jgi:hypothetical protein
MLLACCFPRPALPVARRRGGGFFFKNEMAIVKHH